MEVGTHVWLRYLCSGEVIFSLSQQMQNVVLFIEEFKYMLP
jgi:hypothetical protein